MVKAPRTTAQNKTIFAENCLNLFMQGYDNEFYDYLYEVFIEPDFRREVMGFCFHQRFLEEVRE